MISIRTYYIHTLQSTNIYSYVLCTYFILSILTRYLLVNTNEIIIEARRSHKIRTTTVRFRRTPQSQHIAIVHPVVNKRSKTNGRLEIPIVPIADSA
jgi:hypothetical protein